MLKVIRYMKHTISRFSVAWRSWRIRRELSLIAQRMQKLQKYTKQHYPLIETASMTSSELKPSEQESPCSSTRGVQSHPPVIMDKSYDDARMQEAYYLACHNMDPRDFYQ
jgi:hypothetical protein